jgi:hypothetical protein
MQSFSRQRIGKHVPAATNTNTTLELLLQMVFSTRPVENDYKDDNWGDPVRSHSCVEAGSNTSTVALQVVGSDEKGSLESETIKYGQESHGSRT